MTNVAQNEKESNTEIQYAVETITPDMAEAYLTHNFANNRAIRKDRVASYARDMKAGEWKLTGEAIKFNEDNELVDGQTRLWAVVASGTAAQFLVVRGLPREAVQKLDKGLSRSFADAVKISGTGDTCLTNSNTPALLRLLLDLEMSYRPPTDSEMLFLYEQFSNTIQTVIRTEPYSVWPITAPVRAAYFAALLNGVKEEELYAFSQCLKTGRVIGDYNTTAPMQWKNTLMNAKVKQTGMSRRAIYYGTQNAIYYFLRGKGYRTKFDEPRYPIKDIIASAISGRNEE